MKPQHKLAGSTRSVLPGARAVGKAHPEERLEVSVLLRRRSGEELKRRVEQIATSKETKTYVERERFAQEYGADQSDIDKVKKFANEYGLAVVEADPARRTVILSGTVAEFNKAFEVDLQRFEHPKGSYRGRIGEVHLTDELKDLVEAVLGLDNRPQAHPHFRRRAGMLQRRAFEPSISYTPEKLASLYNFPSGTGKNQCIGIVELGGGYRPADLQAYFQEQGITTPQVSSVSVDHAKNQPTGDPDGPDGEVMLDIEVAGAIAPEASIVVYFAPNTDAGFIDALTKALHDTVNKPSVLSISWGAPESSWTAQAMKAFDQVLQSAAALGVTVCVASGDNGSSDGVNDGQAHVDFPASSPYALACGGTTLRSFDGQMNEVAWNDEGATGGGVSTIFNCPPWQQGLTTKTLHGETQLAKRGVPDVSGDADPQTGYQVIVDGERTVIGGTSAVAPLWAGLIARINSTRSTPLGYINPRLYGNNTAFRDIEQGNNGDFLAKAGWDACTGLGSPDGQKIAQLIGAGSSGGRSS